jgi:hypothetical protein
MNTPISPTPSCPRCGSHIDCRPEAIETCACAQISLAPVTRDYLAETNYDCLCNRCLTELDALARKADQDTFPQPGAPLTEGVHYYLENGLWVFTEYYHLLRGYCCRSGCRHCAYGFRKAER